MIIDAEGKAQRTGRIREEVARQVTTCRVGGRPLRPTIRTAATNKRKVRPLRRTEIAMYTVYTHDNLEAPISLFFF